LPNPSPVPQNIEDDELDQNAARHKLYKGALATMELLPQAAPFFTVLLILAAPLAHAFANAAQTVRPKCLRNACILATPASERLISHTLALCWVGA
jgi:hypothetical protein